MITNDIDEALLVADRIVALTPGPAATLSAQFEVHLDRPRDRTTLNFEPEFKKLRNEILKYMMRIDSDAKLLRVDKAIPLPEVEPINLDSIAAKRRLHLVA
jgi:nitrate/nitrite transport system ATP-binding protein